MDQVRGVREIKVGALGHGSEDEPMTSVISQPTPRLGSPYVFESRATWHGRSRNQYYRYNGCEPRTKLTWRLWLSSCPYWPGTLSLKDARPISLSKRRLYSTCFRISRPSSVFSALSAFLTKLARFGNSDAMFKREMEQVGGFGDEPHVAGATLPSFHAIKIHAKSKPHVARPSGIMSVTKTDTD